MVIREEDREEFINDILALNDNYYTQSGYYPEYLEEDFATIMKKWEERSNG